MDRLAYIKAPVEAELQQFNALLRQTLEHEDGYLDRIFKTIGQRRGKQMRPLLCLLVAKEFGEVRPSALLSALTLEILHTASLIHDDVVDESDERRGQASINNIFGNQVSVLVGDYMLSEALIKAAETGDVGIVKSIAELGKNLSAGEILQLKNTQRNAFSEETYFEIIGLKTAALFAACAEFGALTAGANRETQLQMKQFGQLIGLCFQIRDDMFDYYEDTAIGKPTGSDIAEGKLTLPLLYALNHCDDAEMVELARRARREQLGSEDVRHLVEFAIRAGGIDYARQRMDSLAAEAKTLVAGFCNDAIRQALLAYVDFVADREI